MSLAGESGASEKERSIVERVAVGDGLRLEVKRWRGGGKTPAIGLPGLTRNAADFDGVAGAVAADGRDFLAVSMRGRGGSDWDANYLNYAPTTYRDDVLTAMDALGVERAVFVGTSLGGIVAMLIAEARPDSAAAAIINDVGVRLAPEGLARIAAYVSASDGDAPTAHARLSFADAVAATTRIQTVAFPDADRGFFEAFARRTYRRNEDGSWSLDFDPGVAAALGAVGPAPDLAPGWAALSAKPTLLVRGAISDLITPDIVAEMRVAHPDFQEVVVPRVGHAPTLEEPDAARAIAAFLSQID
ncbi:MAG: alpha/beta fold hydrolase [Parvularculaceae bacterium]